VFAEIFVDTDACTRLDGVIQFTLLRGEIDKNLLDGLRLDTRKGGTFSGRTIIGRPLILSFFIRRIIRPRKTSCIRIAPGLAPSARKFSANIGNELKAGISRKRSKGNMSLRLL
jgi:hypothetical protein